MSVEQYIRTIPDFPHEGIMFRDITTLFSDPVGLKLAIDQLVDKYRGQPIDYVAGVEARGFILGGAMAHQLECGFLAVRKKGKLPWSTIEQSYELEYGEAVVEVHDDAAKPGDRVLVVDDLIATGGTADAAVKLVGRLGAEVVGAAFVIDLPDLGGANRLRDQGVDVFSLCEFAGE